MINNRTFKKTAALAVIAAMGLTPAVSVCAAAAVSGNKAAENDLVNADVIDESKTGSIAIYKYDMTAAEAAGDYKEGTFKATGEKDDRVESAMKDYGVEGVQFSYVRVGDVETHSTRTGTAHSIELVYEIPEKLADILKLSETDAVDMRAAGESNPCSHAGVLHYTSQQLTDAMSALLKEDNVEAKNALESYLYEYGTLDSTTDQAAKNGAVNMKKTDASGYTYADNLELGLYLFVETEVPENVVETINPWLVQLPFTNTSAQTSEDGVSYETNGSHNADGVTNAQKAEGTEAKVSGGEEWLYDMTCYPKNQTGNPTIDKSVREAFGSQDAAGEEYTYEDTTTASEGDVLDYILVSKLPHITSSATYLSEYRFVDTLSGGIAYNQDAKIAFYHSAEDANSNNTANADLIWDLSDDTYAQNYAEISFRESEGEEVSEGRASQLSVTLTEKGLAVLNGADQANRAGFSDYYMVVYYTASVNSDASVILGDEGNPNDVALLWSRTSDGYCNMLEDRNYVYAYGMDLTKTFSDEKGDFSNVQFKLYNQTDDYYVTALQDSDGVYYVTGRTDSKADAATFVPSGKDGSLLINGMEADSYRLTEVATDDGYSLLKEAIEIDIVATDRDVIASVAGVTGMDESAVDEIVKNYRGGIYDENGNLVTSSWDDITLDAANYPAAEDANGRTIGKTDMYVGPIQTAFSTVDEIDARMTEGNASVLLSVQNSKKFPLPQTGGRGVYAVTVMGAAAAAGGCYLAARKKNPQSR